MANASQRIAEKLSKSVCELESQHHCEGENENVFDCGLATAFECYHQIMIAVGWITVKLLETD